MITANNGSLWALSAMAAHTVEKENQLCIQGRLIFSQYLQSQKLHF